MAENDQILEKIAHLESLIASFRQTSVCETHRQLVEQITDLIAKLAVVPTQLESISKEFKFVGSEMHRRTEVLFGKVEKIETKINEHDLSLNTVENKIENLVKAHLDKRLHFLESWRVKVVAVVATVGWLVSVGLSILSLVKK